MDNLFVRPERKTDAVKKTPHIVRNVALIGEWSEVAGIDAQTLNKKLSNENLDGLIIKGYEMKFDQMNFNREMYDRDAYDEFIQSYFVDNGLNMPVDINHGGQCNWRDYCGRVLYCEVNTVGLYFVVYVPRTYADYDRLLWGLQNGFIQGLSKEGFVDADDFDWIWNEDGTFDHEQIHRMQIVSVSLVYTPANAIPFERVQEVRNALVFENKNRKDNADRDTLDAMFN